MTEPTLTDKLNDPANWDIEGLIDDVKDELDSYGADDAIELINWLHRELSKGAGVVDVPNCN